MGEIIPRRPGQNPLQETRAEAELKVNKKIITFKLLKYLTILIDL